MAESIRETLALAPASRVSQARERRTTSAKVNLCIIINISVSAVGNTL